MGNDIKGLPATQGIADRETRLAIDGLIQIIKKESDKAREGKQSIFGDPEKLKREILMWVSNATLKANAVQNQTVEVTGDQSTIFVTKEEDHNVRRYRVNFDGSSMRELGGSIKIVTVRYFSSTENGYYVQDTEGNNFFAYLYDGILATGETLPPDEIYPVVNLGGTWYFFSVSRFI